MKRRDKFAEAFEEITSVPFYDAEPKTEEATEQEKPKEE